MNGQKWSLFIIIFLIFSTPKKTAMKKEDKGKGNCCVRDGE